MRVPGQNPTPPLQETASVAILMGTYRGRHFLTQQLGSIETQTHNNWKVWVSDDGSDDGTIDILKQYQTNWGENKLTILPGPQQGFCINFLSLACNPSIDADYYSFCDQDDVWEPDKLACALSWITRIPGNVPALYCGRTQMIDWDNRPVGFSPHFRLPPSFANALVQSIAGGNTMLFNGTLRSLLCKAGVNAGIVSHDWWTYIVATACGGVVNYDARPTVRYRQHGTNMVGENMSLSARYERLRLLLKGQMREWTSRNIATLRSIQSDITEDSLRTLEQFCTARNSRLLPRIAGIRRSGVVRQTFLGNLGLIAAAVLKKI